MADRTELQFNAAAWAEKARQSTPKDVDFVMIFWPKGHPKGGAMAGSVPADVLKQVLRSILADMTGLIQ